MQKREALNAGGSCIITERISTITVIFLNVVKLNKCIKCFFGFFFFHCRNLKVRWGQQNLPQEVWQSKILTMSIMDHSPTTGVVTVIVILIAIAALGALILGCWCYLRLQRISQSEDEESIVGEGETKEPFLLVQYSAKGPCVERKAKLTPNSTEVHS